MRLQGRRKPIVADDTARAEFVAADMLAQAEHGEDASAILITTSESLAHEIAREVERQLETLPRRQIAETSLKAYGAIILIETLEEGCSIVNELAPEHVEISTRDDETVAAKIRHAGAIFFDRTRRRPLAITLLVQITCCRREERPAFLQRSVFTIL